jgi:Zn-dependent protease
VAVFLLLGLAGRAAPDSSLLETGQRMMAWGVWLNLVLGFFNILPIPPLDGSHVLFHLLPPVLREPYRRFQRFGFLPLLALLLFFPRAIQVLLTPAYLGMGLFLRLASPFAVGTDWNIFPS